MKKELESRFVTRQYMLAQDFEVYYYSDSGMAEVRTHSHDYYEFYFFLEGDVCMKIGERSYLLKYGDIILIPPQIPHCAITVSYTHLSNPPPRSAMFRCGKI